MYHFPEEEDVLAFPIIDQVIYTVKEDTRAWLQDEKTSAQLEEKDASICSCSKSM